MSFINVGPKRAYTSINTAIYTAADGDTILLDEGTYDEEVYLNYRHVNIVGNTKNPHHGKVKIRRLSSSTADQSLYVRGGYNKTFYFEGIHFVWSKADDADPDYSEMILFENCDGATMIFNRCIIDASFYFEYVFDSNSDVDKIRLLNCRLNYKPVTEFYGNIVYFFDKAADYLLYDIRKCVTPYEVNITYKRYPESPNGAHINTLPDATISGGWSNVSNLFDFDYDTYCSLDGTTVDQPYYLYVEYDEPKIISRWMYYINNWSLNHAGKIKVQASINNIDWIDTPSSYTRDDHYEMEAFATQLTVSYKYYRLEVIAVTSSIQLHSLVFLEKGNDNFQFDCVTLPGKVGYGPAYGDYFTSIPTKYYFKGTVYDPVSDNNVVDTVAWSPSDKSNAISLSNGDHRATVQTIDKYTDYGIRATVSRKTGKWYLEFKSSSTYGLCRVGLGTYQTSIDHALGYDSYSFGYEHKTGYIYRNNVVIVEGPPCNNDDIIGIAYNAYDGKIWFSCNGQWFLGGNPVSGDNPTIEVQADLYPMASLQSSATAAATVDLLIDTPSLNYDIPEGYSFYGTKVIWRVKAINAVTNDLEGWAYSDPLDSSYEVFTSYSGSHFLICEDADEDPVYNDLLLGRLIPEEFVL